MIHIAGYGVLLPANRTQSIDFAAIIGLTNEQTAAAASCSRPDLVVSCKVITSDAHQILRLQAALRYVTLTDWLTVGGQITSDHIFLGQRHESLCPGAALSHTPDLTLNALQTKFLSSVTGSVMKIYMLVLCQKCILLLWKQIQTIISMEVYITDGQKGV